MAACVRIIVVAELYFKLMAELLMKSKKLLGVSHAKNI